MNTPMRAEGLPELDSDDGARRQLRSTLVVSSLRLGGKLLGLVKMLVIASLFGASGSLDAFWIAYTVPAMLPGVILGVVATAFIPRFMHSSAEGEERMDWQGLNTLLTLVGFCVLLLAGLLAWGNHAVVSFMAPGLTPEVHGIAADLTRWMAIAVLLFGFNAMLATVLQAFQRFTLLSLESLTSNTVIIAACILLAPRHGVDALVGGVIGGFAVQFLLLAWGCRDQIRTQLRPALALRHDDFRGAWRHMTPLLIGYLGATAMAIVDRMFLSTLDSGAISILAYAVMLAALPMEVFGQAVLTVFYPALSQAHSNGSNDALVSIHRRAMRLLMFLLLPLTVFCIAAADPLVSLLFEHGRFGREEAATTAVVLMALAAGIPATAIKFLNFRLLHARQEPWSAVAVGLFGVMLNALLDYLLIGPFGVAGVAAATSIALVVTATLSSMIVSRRLGVALLRPLWKSTSLVGGLCLVMLLIAGAIGRMDSWFYGEISPTLSALWQLLSYLPAALLFMALAIVLRVDEARALMELLGMRSLARRMEALR